MPVAIDISNGQVRRRDSVSGEAQERDCRHCGTPFRPTTHRPDFCCAGCQFVHDLIAKNGLGQFYDLQAGGQPPVAALVFQRRDFGWLEDLARLSEGKLQLDVQGVSCLGCAWLIERLFGRRTGALAIHVEPAMGQLELRVRPDAFDAVAFARELQSFGYLVGPPCKAAPASRALRLRLGLCAALALNTMLFTLPRYLGMGDDFEFAALFERITFVLGTFSFLMGGSYFFARTWRSLRQGVLHIDLPISLGLGAAYAGSLVAWMRGADNFVYFDFVATFSLLMLAGRWLQLQALERNRQQLLSVQGDPAPVRDATTHEPLPVTEISPGTGFAIEPGQAVPVRSLLKSEAATLGLEWISGETEAMVARRGRVVAAGSVNCGQGAIALEALEPWSESLLARLLHLTPAAALRDLTTERFIRGYILAVLAMGCIGFGGWWAVRGELLPALQVLISVLVVSCPCASGVALPLTRELATSQLRRFGVFVCRSEIWSKLDRVRHLIFDKTGTLTLETVTLRNPDALGPLTDVQRGVLLSMVRTNLHPVSGCLREQLLAAGAQPVTDAPVVETIGFGLALEYDGATWKLGRPEWTGSAVGECAFTRNDEVLANFRFGEEARADAVEEIATLRQRGCRISILSGDRRAKVDAMADRLRLPRPDCHATLSPEEKAEWVTTHDQRDTLYLGDGANDSLAFDAAWCTGTPAIDRGLLEQKADFYFLGRGLNGVRALLETAAQRRRTARIVVAFAVAYNTVAIALCLAGRMNPLLAAILMPASSIVSLAIVVAGLRPWRAITNSIPGARW
ncbi:MAG: heavy metal translocating P-type ATPase metal-binding domain-containing protein, partial [Chthoniobacteraceae bacterium]